MKTLILILSVFIFNFSAFGQCDLTLTDAPTIRGFKLGMSKDEADKITSGIAKIKFSKNIITLTNTDFVNSKRFENVRFLEAQFYDDKLYRFEIAYNRAAVAWKSGKEFARNLSDNLKLPLEFWTFEEENPLQAKILCKDFSMFINADLNNILLEDLTAKEQMQKVEDDRKNVFKP